MRNTTHSTCRAALAHLSLYFYYFSVMADASSQMNQEKMSCGSVHAGEAAPGSFIFFLSLSTAAFTMFNVSNVGGVLTWPAAVKLATL